MIFQQKRDTQTLHHYIYIVGYVSFALGTFAPPLFDAFAPPHLTLLPPLKSTFAPPNLYQLPPNSFLSIYVRQIFKLNVGC